VDLQEIVKAIDVADPLLGTAMDDLGEIGQSGFTQVEKLLPLQVPFGTLS
jgi:hypothetical protein